MDPELIEYLDRRFGETNSRIDENNQHLAETNQHLAETNQRLDETNRRLAEGFESAGQRIDETNQRVDRVAGQVRQTHVVIEALRSDLQGVAEGVANVDQKLDRRWRQRGLERQEDRALMSSVFGHIRRRQDDHEIRLTRLESSGG